MFFGFSSTCLSSEFMNIYSNYINALSANDYEKIFSFYSPDRKKRTISNKGKVNALYPYRMGLEIINLKNHESFIKGGYGYLKVYGENYRNKKPISKTIQFKKIGTWKIHCYYTAYNSKTAPTIENIRELLPFCFETQKEENL